MSDEIDRDSLTSAQRLLAGKDLQRQAGLELLREMVQRDRLVTECCAIAETYQTDRQKLTATDTQLLAVILAAEQTEATLDNALGLVDRASLTPVIKPQPDRDVTIQTPASINCLLAIDELVHTHHQTPVMVTNWRDESEDEDEEIEETTTEIEDPTFTKIRNQLINLTGESKNLRYPGQVERIVLWLLYLHPPQELREFAIDALGMRI